MHCKQHFFFPSLPGATQSLLPFRTLFFFSLSVTTSLMLTNIVTLVCVCLFVFASLSDGRSVVHAWDIGMPIVL
jgi:hypothetical protein